MLDIINTIGKVLSSISVDTWVQSQLVNNDFLIASLFAIITSVGLYLLRNVPKTIWSFVKQKLSYEITVNSSSEYYANISAALASSAISIFSRQKVLTNTSLSIGYGRSIVYFLGRLAIVDRKMLESQSREFKETISVTFPCIYHGGIESRFVSFVETIAKGDNDKLLIYGLTEYQLSVTNRANKRPEGSIFIDEEVMSKCTSYIDTFLSSKDWYAKHGIPYKLGILLYGPPGTGKTSLIRYLASKYNCNIIMTTPDKLPKLSSRLVEREVGDYDSYGDYVKNSFNKIDETVKFFIVLEDIDCADVTTTRDDEYDDSKPRPAPTNPFATNLSSILNVLDGIHSPENVIFVATTNHLEKLDPALIRRGRFDCLVEISPLSDKHIKEMISSFFDISMRELTGYTFEDIPGAELQGLILEHINDLQKLIEVLPRK